MQTRKEEPERVGVILGPLGKINKNALKYMLLQLNKIQGSFEYEILPSAPWDPLMKALRASEPPPNRDALRPLIASFRQRYEIFFSDQLGLYKLQGELPECLVILSLASLSDNYFHLAERSHRVSVVALGNWHRGMAPPSIVEFFVMLTVRSSLMISRADLPARGHLGTRGCFGDFTADLTETRYFVLNGYLCASCKATIEMSSEPHIATSLEQVPVRSWVGRPDEDGSPSNVCRKLGYDLFVTQGIRPTYTESLRKIIAEDGVKQAMQVIAAILIAAALLFLGLK